MAENLFVAKNLLWNSDGSGPLGSKDDGVTLQRPTNAWIKEFLAMGDITTPSNPPAGIHKLYTKADDLLYILNSSGTEAVVGSSTPAGLDTEVQFNDGGTDFGADSNFTWDNVAKRLRVNSIHALSNIGIRTAVASAALEINATSNNSTSQNVILLDSKAFNSTGTVRGQSDGTLSGGTDLLSLIGSWGGTDVAEIECLSGLDGATNDDGELAFKTKTVGEPLNERMRIDRFGKILVNTLTAQPSRPNDTSLNIRGITASGNQPALHPSIGLFSDVLNQFSQILVDIDANAPNFNIGTIDSRWNGTRVGQFGVLTGDTGGTTKDDAIFRIFLNNNATGFTQVFKINTSKDVEIANNLEVGGEILNSLGTVSNPSYSFLGDENTGMYSQSSGLLDFAVNGTKVFEMQSNRLTVFKPTRYIGGVDIGLGADRPGSIFLNTKVDIGGGAVTLENSGGALLSTTGGAFSFTNREYLYTYRSITI